MNKIYKVDSFEKLEYLLNTLHERGAKWSSGDELNDKEKMTRIWNEYSVNNIFWRCGLIIYNESGSVLYDEPRHLIQAIKSYVEEGQAYIIIGDVKLPNPKQSEDGKTIADATDSSQVEQPSHYIGEKGLEVREIEENFLVRYQDGHLAHLAGALLEYLLRAPSKGKLEEDIQKVQYLANEMVEYVKRVEKLEAERDTEE